VKGPIVALACQVFVASNAPGVPVVPESQSGGHADLATSGAIIGFTRLMVLDVALA
jgi:hypothetical protein